MISNDIKTSKKTFWGAMVFYILIAFEFFYMASPFAGYFYFVYQPVLNLLNHTPVLAGLVNYFLPHFATTSSVIINIHNTVGGILFVSGLLAFVIGASQVYYYKLTRKGIVTGGIYNLIRHPQYASFIISSFGLLLLWPRYIVLVMFITMLFVYYFLAKAEEKECEIKYGQSYIDYKKKTGMFFPFRIPIIKKYPPIKSHSIKILTGFGSYLVMLAMAMGIATWIDNFTLNHLYAVFKNNSANIALNKMDKAKMVKVLNIALSSEVAQGKIDSFKLGKNEKFLNYIMPSNWYAAEIPMNGIDINRNSHSMPANYNRKSFKIIFTKAIMRFKDGAVYHNDNFTDNSLKGKDMIRNITKREPILEVWVDIDHNKVTKILEMPNRIMYQNVPVALY